MPKKKNPESPKVSGKAAGKPAKTPKGAEQRPEQRIAQVRDKLTTAMKDPLTREQIVRAIRAMMQEK